MIRTLMILSLAMPAFAEEALLVCRDNQNARARLACYDRIVDSQYPREVRAGDTTGATRSQAPQPDRTAQTSTTTAPAVVQQSVPQAGGEVVQPAAESVDDSVAEFGIPVRKAEEARTEIDAIVAEVTKSAHKKYTITLDNQQIWRQLDSQTMRLTAGDEITIRAASLDSYLLRKRTGGKSIRVKRLE